MKRIDQVNKVKRGVNKVGSHLRSLENGANKVESETNKIGSHLQNVGDEANKVKYFFTK